MEVSFWYSGMCQQCTICLKCFFRPQASQCWLMEKTPTISAARDCLKTLFRFLIVVDILLLSYKLIHPHIY